MAVRPRRRANKKWTFKDVLGSVAISVKTIRGAAALASIFQQGHLDKRTVCIPHKTLWKPIADAIDSFHMIRLTAATIGEAFMFKMNVSSALAPLANSNIGTAHQLNDSDSATVLLVSNTFGANSAQLVSSGDGWDTSFCQWAIVKVKVRNDNVFDVYFGGRVDLVHSVGSDGNAVRSSDLGVQVLATDNAESIRNWNRSFSGCEMIRVPGLGSGSTSAAGAQTQAGERTREFHMKIPCEALLKANLKHAVGAAGEMRWRIEQGAATSSVSNPAGHVNVAFFVLPCDHNDILPSVAVTSAFICATFNVMEVELEQCFMYMDKSDVTVAS